MWGCPILKSPVSRKVSPSPSLIVDHDQDEILSQLSHLSVGIQSVKLNVMLLRVVATNKIRELSMTKIQSAILLLLLV